MMKLSLSVVLLLAVFVSFFANVLLLVINSNYFSNSIYCGKLMCTGYDQNNIGVKGVSVRGTYFILDLLIGKADYRNM